MTTSQLTDAEKLRIRQEESFRNELRAELGASATDSIPKTRRQRLWAFLNSNFGMWMLSAICISGLGTLYTNQQNTVHEEMTKRELEQAEQLRSKELCERLTLEISFRLSSAMSRLHVASFQFGDTVSPKSQNAITNAFEPLVRPATDTVPPLFPEFKSYSGLALIAELRRHTPPGEQERLKQILNDTSGLTYESTGESILRTSRSAKAVASLLLERMQYSIWNKGFPYTDCKKEAPFC